MPSASGRTVEDAILALSRQVETQHRSLRELERYLGSLHQDVYFGPLSGAYFPVVLGRSTDTGTPLPATPVDLFSFGWEMRPVALSIVCFFGDLTADILSEGVSILSAGPIALSGGVPVVLNSRGDFLVEKVTGDLTLDIVSIDGGTVPEHIRATIMNKNVSKVEPA